MNNINSVYKHFILVFISFLSISIVSLNHIEASEKIKPKNNKASKIRITSNRMKAVSKAKYAEFIGNVRAVQGKFSLTSDVLRIYYTEGSEESSKPVKKGSISKIVAKGNVHIKAEDFTAVSDLALYLPGPMIIILKGSNSKVTSGENSIVGSKITYYRNDGRIKIEGTPDKRVEGVFYSRKNDKGDFTIIPSPDTKEEKLPSTSGPTKPLEEKEIAE